MTRPLVTIISPTYNQERFVGECAESALAQTYSDWEQIFVDDGSTDHTREIIQSYRDPRIRLIALPHRGLNALAMSYNVALAASNGPLVAILEGDDAWPADKLELQVPLFDDPLTVLSWGRGVRVDERSQVVGDFTTVHTNERVIRLSTAAAFERLSRSNLFAPSLTVMLRRRALDDTGGFRQTGSKLFVDLPTWLWTTAVNDGQVVFLNRVLGLYRVHPEQTTQTAGIEMTRQHLEAVLRTVEALDQESLARVGWNERARRRAVARGRLAEGESLLATRRFAEAGAEFKAAFAAADGMADRLLALGGRASALLRADLVKPVFSMRESIRRQLRRD